MRQGLDTAVNNLSSALFNLTQELRETAKAEVSQVPVSFAPTKTMKDAIEMASAKCEYWIMDGESGAIGLSALQMAGEVYDMRLHFSIEESEKYYLVTDDGSIGMTMDGCATIDWLFNRA